MFALPDADMESVDLARYRGKKSIVLFFYPRDGSPSCTLQATEFSDHEDEFARHDCIVIGVSPDDCLCHAQFRDQHGVSVRLLADTEGEVCRKYGVLQQDVQAGRKGSVGHATFVIDKKGVVRHAFYGVRPRGHALEVLHLVKSLR